MSGIVDPAEGRALPRFVGAMAWSDLNEREKGTIGGVALELVMAWTLLEEGPDLGEDERERARLARAAEAAEQLLTGELVREVRKAVDVSVIGLGIPSLLGPVCRECGCSHWDPCMPEPCSWAEKELCSNCAGERT